ncbi:hypothetical protein SK128_025958 [Halocaridina rubra]|uniref:Uncharacterized protein n=1 Tax=Halocaridina rubra TaxID=373956 RepID=A0AAN8X4Q7_HALRR
MLGAVDGVVPMVSFALMVMVTDKRGDYNVETAVPPPLEGPVKEKSLVMRKDSKWLYDEENQGKIRIATVLLSAINFSIEVPNIEYTFGKPLETIQEEPEVEVSEEEEEESEKKEKQERESFENNAYESEN